MHNFYDTVLNRIQTPTMLTMRGLSLEPLLLSRLGIVPIEYAYPDHDPYTHCIEVDAPPVPKEDGTAYIQNFTVQPLPLADLPGKLEQLKREKKAEFDAFFLALDAQKSRPASAIAEMTALGLAPNVEDVNRLTILNMVAEENRQILQSLLSSSLPDSADFAAACAILHAVQAVQPWQVEGAAQNEDGFPPSQE